MAGTQSSLRAVWALCRGADTPHPFTCQFRSHRVRQPSSSSAFFARCWWAYLYAGKSWCQYFCPMAIVQTVYTGPRSLLGSQNHLQPKAAVTQSMCRMVDPKTGKEQSACVSCKAPCIDVDAEKTYWAELNKPGRRLVQYGYLGMVIAFYLYYLPLRRQLGLLLLRRMDSRRRSSCQSDGYGLLHLWA